MSKIRRVFVEKKQGYDVAAEQLLADFKESLNLDKLKELRLINRYDIAEISDSAFEESCRTILAEGPVDNLYQENLDFAEDADVFAVEYLPGQYDQRADSAEQCMQILNDDEKPKVRTAEVIVLKGELSEKDISALKDYYINPVDSREASLQKPDSLDLEYKVPEKISTLNGFIKKDKRELEEMIAELGLAMNMADLLHTQRYFRDDEKRDPSITEIRVLDTYWSDHCRHTTFLSSIKNVEIEENKYTEVIKKAYQEYLNARKKIYSGQDKDICLMDIALMGMKELRAEGKLEDLEISDEVNAASIEVSVDVDGKEEDWLVMFKNETHNHPTEIEPFGGAATCLGGAIRDPLAGRSYVYQAMRVTGAGDPRTPVEETIAGKLPQKKIVQEASDGYSSYGNQIGLATGIVNELYNERYTAKHMEIGAVIAAAPKYNVYRGQAEAGDTVILVGGRTGRDGCGGATGSSKVHTEESIEESSAEVQKGNPPTERKIQRLFRNPDLSRLIKVCNDFGAGGVSVAVGELADALEINLDAVPKKYEGLDGTELAISESQERMAVVVDKDDVEDFIELSEEENLEAAVIAEVKAHRRLIMNWNGDDIVNVSRDFLDTNGASQSAQVKAAAPIEEDNYFKNAFQNRLNIKTDLKNKWLANLSDINIASQKGLKEKFDSSVGAGSVLMPFGGKYQLTPAQAMAAKIPLLEGETSTGTLMSHGFDSQLSTWSPFHGAFYAVIESISKIVASGGDYRNIRFSFQEYFERLRNDPERWGKPFSALLGGYYAQKRFELPAVGGKDSMSGTFHEIDVPPTLVSFAVDKVDVNNVISPEFKNKESLIVYLPVLRDEDEIADTDKLKNNYLLVKKLIDQKIIKAASAVTLGGPAEALSKMSFGNKIGFKLNDKLDEAELFSPEYGALILEVDSDSELERLFADTEYRLIGKTISNKIHNINGTKIELEEALKSWQSPLEKIYPTKVKTIKEEAASNSAELNDKGINNSYEAETSKELLDFEPFTEAVKVNSNIKAAKPRVLIPVFPGTNCEYDTARQFREAGAEIESFVFKNLSAEQIEASISGIAESINNSQMVVIPGGFSAGDEPDGSGKFIAAVFRNPQIKEAVEKLLNNRDGLMLGICNGFQALIKLGLVPYGEIRELDESAPTLTYNTIGRHISCMAQTKITSNKSPWLRNTEVGEIYNIAFSHGEGRFTADKTLIKELQKNGQIAAQYVDFDGNPSMGIEFNPNGSDAAVEALTSPDGRVLGKMGHSERIGSNVAKNIIGKKDQQLFKAGVEYFKK